MSLRKKIAKKCVQTYFFPKTIHEIFSRKKVANKLLCTSAIVKKCHRKLLSMRLKFAQSGQPGPQLVKPKFAKEVKNVLITERPSLRSNLELRLTQATQPNFI
jgi:hypothetical protein